MEFFEMIKSTLRRRTLKRAFIFIAIAVGLIAVVFSNGFSTEEIWVRRIGYVPEWLLSSIFLLLALSLACLSISSFKDFVKNKEYNALLASVEKIGDINSIGSVLSNLNKSPYTEKGDDLRYNDQLLFYMEDTNVAIIRVNDIVDIRYEKLEPNKESKKYQVCLTYYDGVLKIKTAEKNILALYDDLKKNLAIDAIDNQAHPQPSVCPICGTEYSDTTNYCSACGKKIR